MIHVDLHVNLNNAYKMVCLFSHYLIETENCEIEMCSFFLIFFCSLCSGDISEEAKNAYNLLINGQKANCSEQIDTQTKESPTRTNFFGSSSSSSSTSISTSSTSNPTQSNTSSSSNQQKSNRNSHYSSTSTDNDISLDLKPQNDLSPLKYKEKIISIYRN